MNTPETPDTPAPQRIEVRHAELGGHFAIRRALPTRERRMVGAWCFLDHIGPASLDGTGGMHVGAHPHTCLQTFTWMIEGQILHKDSLGTQQVIRPGQVNLMTAGHGISHTEDSLPGETHLHAAQLWIALPAEHADIPPAFEHHPILPGWQSDGAQFTLLAGQWREHVAPARLYSRLLGLDIASGDGARISLPLEPDFEYGLLVLSGNALVSGELFDADHFAYLGMGEPELELTLAANSRVLLLGGEPFQSPMNMWWNFIGPTRAHVAQAQADWESGSSRFGSVDGGEGRRLAAPALPAGYALHPATGAGRPIG